MSHDISPNVATRIMDVKDKVIVPEVLRGVNNEIILSWANPASIAHEINRQIEKAQKNPEGPEKSLLRARNTVNAIRLNGPTAFVSQHQRLSAAATLARHITEPQLPGDSQDILNQKQEKYQTTLSFLAAALGHKDSIKKIEREQDEAAEKYHNSP